MKLVVSELRLYAWNQVYASTTLVNGTDATELLTPVLVDSGLAQSLRNQAEGGMRDAFNSTWGSQYGNIGQNDIEYLC